MILAEMALTSNEIPIAPDEEVFDASDVLATLFAPENEGTTQLLLAQSDARPMSEYFHIEYGGPALAHLLGLPQTHGGQYPRAAVKGAHIADAYTADETQALYNDFVSGMEGRELDLPPYDGIDPYTNIPSFTTFTIVISLEPEKLSHSYAQVHHHEGGVLMPNFELMTSLIESEDEAETVPRLANLIKRAALRLFVYQQNFPFRTELRETTLVTILGDYPVKVNHLLPDVD